MDVIETVEEHCVHMDCVYRMTLERGVPFCNYCAMEEEPRGCKISECTRYRTGTRTVTMTKEGLHFLWRIEQERNE